MNCTGTGGVLFILVFCVLWNGISWFAVGTLITVGVNTINENNDHAKYLDANCSLLSDKVIQTTCDACRENQPQRRSDHIRRRKSCSIKTWHCYQVRYQVQFVDVSSGLTIRSSATEPAVSDGELLVHSCSACVRDADEITDKYQDIVGSTNATTACHFDKDDPAGTVQLSVVSTSTTTIIFYFAVAAGIALCFGGVGCFLCCTLFKSILVLCDEGGCSCSTGPCCGCWRWFNRDGGHDDAPLLPHMVVVPRNHGEDLVTTKSQTVPPGGGSVVIEPPPYSTQA